MTSQLVYTSMPSGSSPVEELSEVALRETVMASDGAVVAAGAIGVVLSRLGDGDAYIVEFAAEGSRTDSAFPPLLATVEARKLMPVPGATRDDLAARVADKLRH